MEPGLPSQPKRRLDKCTQPGSHPPEEELEITRAAIEATTGRRVGGVAGAGVAHYATSNCYMADGAIRMGDLRSAGGVVSLGTDGSACDHRQDMFEQMKQAIFVQRLTTLEPTALRSEEALELATREGARYLGIDAGVLAPGCMACWTRGDRQPTPEVAGT